MRKYVFRSALCAVVLLGFSLNLLGQNLKENKRMAQSIQEDIVNFRYGIGDGTNVSSATQQAMQMLLLGISSQIESRTNLTMENSWKGDSAQSSSTMGNELSMRAAGQLRGVKTLILANPPQCRVMAYITKAQLDTIYSRRYQRAVQFYIDAQRAESKGNVSDALRFCTWALCLVNSTDDPSSMKYEDKLLINVIPELTKDILRNLDTKVAEVNGQDVKLYTTYKGEPVSSLDFTYNNGLGMSSLQHSAKDGMSYITLSKNYGADKIHLHYELQFKGETRNDPELAYLIEMYGNTDYDLANGIADMGNKKQMKETKAQFEAAAQSEATPTDDFLKRSHAKDYTKTVLSIAEAIRSKQYEKVQEYFTPEGYAMFTGLINYGKAEILTIPELHCFPFRDKIVCRSIPMRFTYKNNKRVFVEDVTFTFNRDELIENVSFGLDKATREQIYTDRHLQYWGDSTCTMLATFLENYATAFALHRMEYIREIFADYAVIITGHKLERANPSVKGDDRRFIIKSQNDKFGYMKMDKDLYMNRLEECFKRNEFINIHFSDCFMEKAYDARFGINIRQDYYSSTYSDTGFLFLLLDVSDPEKPLIQYRSWQPERDPLVNNKVSADDPRRGLVTIGRID